MFFSPFFVVHQLWGLDVSELLLQTGVGRMEGCNAQILPVEPADPVKNTTSIVVRSQEF